MFELVKIIGAKSNAPEPVKLTATAGEVYKSGEALHISGGLATKASGATAVTHISLESKTGASGGKLLCYAVTPGMIFEVPVEDINTTYHKVGLMAGIYSDGLRITDSKADTVLYGSTASGSYSSGTAIPYTGIVGALIVDMNGAVADGDRVLVRLA